mmetsp:Transcript_37927/g.45726  ORF Transcript_37927/g.45726 Transcript_37927/m.45726 type:complete len:115 (-) Transcript_37927:465-809(-)
MNEAKKVMLADDAPAPKPKPAAEAANPSHSSPAASIPSKEPSSKTAPTPSPKSKPKAPVPAPEPLPTLDDLFRKTKAKPPIYWLPLTDEQVALKKLNSQPKRDRDNLRMAERAK